MVTRRTPTGLITYAMHWNPSERQDAWYVSYCFVETYSDGTETEVMQMHVYPNTISTYAIKDKPSPSGTYDKLHFLKRLSP